MMNWFKKARLSDFERKILANVEASGCQINVIVDPDGDSAPFAYSIGFPETLGQGEVIVLGLAGATGHHVVNDLKAKIQAEGLRLSDGLAIGGILQGADLVCRAIPPEAIVADYFNSAMWFHRHQFGTELTQAFQLVWPDVDGLYPWDAGCHPDVIALQPALYETSIH